MLIIYCCSVLTKHYDENTDYYVNVSFLSKRKQWRYIKDLNKVNGVINTLPHKNSVLRKLFIDKHIDQTGSVISGSYELNLNGFTINYILIKDEFCPQKADKYLKSDTSFYYSKDEPIRKINDWHLM